MRVVTNKQMKEIEQQSLKYDLTFHRLMENAGSAAAALIRRTFNIKGLNCMVFCGAGNNGGDGYVAARKLYENGANVLVVMVGDPPKTPEASAMYNTAVMLEIPIARYSASRDKVLAVLGQADIIVDALCGTGFRDSLNPVAREVCSAINKAIAAVIALDIPSGVECDTGSSDPDAIRADFTVAFDSRKPAHILPAGLPLCGQVEVVDIGIPDAAHAGIDCRFGVFTTDLALSHLPKRDPMSHKGAYGRLLSICGSSRYRGAAALSSMGALRAGTGILTLAATETVCSCVAAQLPEATFFPLPAGQGGSVDPEVDPTLLDPLIAASSAVLLGCGLENGRHARKLLEHVLTTAACPVVVDADGINALARNIDILDEAKAPVILTPHPGEMARLLAVDVSQVEQDRSGVAMRFARKHKVVLVLKGHETVVAPPDGGLMINDTGGPGLAKGGSGDVLAGIIAGFAAQGMDPLYAAACAVHLHGLAADRTAARLSQYAMLPRELLDDFCEILAENDR